MEKMLNASCAMMGKRILTTGKRSSLSNGLNFPPPYGSNQYTKSFTGH